MNFEDIFGFVMLSALFVVPALAISARVALRPIVDSVVRLREVMASQVADRTPALEAEIQQLRTELSWLEREVKRLSEAEGFYHRLLASGNHDFGLHVPAVTSESGDQIDKPEDRSTVA